MKMEIVTCKAPVNIAAMKYWGKRDENLILPLNDSISVTISTDVMCAKTTVAACPDFTEDRMWLNGKEESTLNSRIACCLAEIRAKAKLSSDLEAQKMADWKLHMCSENNFPTAAGLASSAAGYACLVYALSKLFGLKDDLSRIARLGSGSACRSIHGGFVRWHMGERQDGTDSVAKQIAPASHWKQLRILILIVNSMRKTVASAIGMKRSVQTSDFLKHVSGKALSRRVDDLNDAILNKDFEAFATIAMKDSNRLHSVCLDTYPPVHYLNDTSHFIIQLVHMLNDYFGKSKIAYSFDAGPNACLFLLEDDVPLVFSLINHFFPQGAHNDQLYFVGEHIDTAQPSKDVLKAIPLTPLAPGSLKGIIYAGVGDGPEVLGSDHHLLNHNGLPKNVSEVQTNVK